MAALFDLARLARQVVHPAAAGKQVRYQRYDWSLDVLAEWVTVPGDVPLIVEGVYCLEQRLRSAYTYTVFCRAARAVRLRRGLDRDGRDARALWVQDWMPTEEAYAASQGPEEFADLVVDTSTEADGTSQFRIMRWNP